MGGNGSGGHTRNESKSIKSLDVSLELYERQPTESDQAWEAFLKYRELGLQRSLAQVAQSLGKSVQLIERWSRTWSWRLRVTEWDRDLDRRRRQADLQAVSDMRRRQLAMATTVQGLGTVEIQKLLRDAQASENATLTADQALKLIEIGAKLERLNRDEPGEIVEERNKDLDPDQVANRIDQLLKARQK